LPRNSWIPLRVYSRTPEEKRRHSASEKAKWRIPSVVYATTGFIHKCQMAGPTSKDNWITSPVFTDLQMDERAKPFKKNIYMAGMALYHGSFPGGIHAGFECEKDY